LACAVFNAKQGVVVIAMQETLSTLERMRSAVAEVM
jgi:hypothetical protein